MGKLIGWTGMAASAVFLAACGGGGGSPGETHVGYQITLRADRTTLPLNAGHVAPGIGAYAPYTTTLYVNATEGGRPIPNGDDGIFACNVAGGLPSGPLYYLDGKSEHEDDKGNPLAYRNITLGSNAGGNSFHFHAGDQAGVTRVTCTVTDPRDKHTYSASVDISVGSATGMPASVTGKTQAPGYLGSQGNLNNIRNNVTIQAFLMDDANQPIGNPAAANVEIRILGGSAAAGAMLIQGSQRGTSVQAQTVGGIAQFSLSSGPNTGTIVLELVADRADNNVANGVRAEDKVAQLLAVPVIDGTTPVAPVVVEPVSLTMEQGTPFWYALDAKGAPPYTWTALGKMPAGLQFTSDGVISGTPTASPGTYGVRVRVTDANGASAETAVTIVVTPPPAPAPSASAASST